MEGGVRARCPSHKIIVMVSAMSAARAGIAKIAIRGSVVIRTPKHHIGAFSDWVTAKLAD
jgi:hypothetical protein